MDAAFFALGVALQNGGEGAAGLSSSIASSLGGVDRTTLDASQVAAQTLSSSEWLGPLAPVALSPFFGLTILSGISCYGPEWLQQRSTLFQENSALNSPWLFWSMLVLALLSSLPRLTKVSKPLALAAENLETYSAIIILVVVRLFGSATTAPLDPADTLAVGNAATDGVLMANVAVSGLSWSTPVDLLMAVFAGLNVIVINAIKLLFEFMVWLVPFPTVDALLELGNKTLCATLMSLYCYSPTAATIVNLLLLTASGLIFGWAMRRLHFYREMIAGPILAWIWPSWFAQRNPYFHAYCAEPLGSLRRYSRVGVQRVDERTMRVKGRWLWRSFDQTLPATSFVSRPGVLFQTIEMTAEDGRTYKLLHRRWCRHDAEFQGSAAVLAPASGN